MSFIHSALETLTLSIINRYVAFSLAVIFTCLGILSIPYWNGGWVVAGIAGVFTLIGVIDLIQSQHAVLRNYPILGHIRYLVEDIRPEIRQYLLEADDDALPFSRSQRSLVYARAKAEQSDKPFGTLMNVYENGYEFIGHSARPMPESDPEQFRLTIGGEQCKQPYSASIFNISAMSFGSLSGNAIEALNKGAAAGNFAHDTGEGGISPYHRKHGGDLIWEIGSGYFGCRDKDGTFDPDRFAEASAHEQVKMIEIKLSQGAKPGHGGILPGTKVTAEIAATRGVKEGVECVSPSRHSAFTTPLEMMEFLARLRALSGGKPTGFKLCIGHPWEFMGIVKAMLETKIFPDFIVIDGGEGGTGAAPVEFIDHLGMPLREGLLFIHNTLTGVGLRDKIHIGASGKIVSAFDIARVLALGADWANSARGFMFSVGCIQSRSCHTNKCPTGVATQDKLRQRALVVPDKAERVTSFHANTVKALAQMLAAAGLDRPEELAPHHIVRRISATETRLFSQLHYFVQPGAIIENAPNLSDFYRASWAMARADSFDARRG
jgi:glutamate synthase domain-containing protein 2